MMLRAPSPPELGDRIAIVGMGCILPGGIESPQALWDFLWTGREAMTDVPADRWNADAIYDPIPGTAGKTAVRRGAFLNNITDFDPAFFNLSPREAAVMDPQQRLLLEAAWRSLEDAGIPVERLAGTMTGVYIGISHSDYHAIQKFGRRQIDVHTATGGALSIAAARLSHMFDLRGRALAVDTACSSSLVALDLACSDLLRGECEMALVGGVNAILTPDVTITFSRANMLAPDGRCKAFDARANGYVRGEGVGIVVLKPLSRARFDGDRIHAVIASTAVNQDGRTSTITVPSLDAQVAMLRDACRKADVDPARIAYVEAHGTGTPVGDPIEARAIGTVFGADRPLDRRCLIGSIKTNIGHLEPAAGVAGLIKAALCVRHGAIPASLNFERPNPNIDFEGLGIAVAQSNTAWDFGAPRIAAVNSFGFGGTNACAILMQPEDVQIEPAPAPAVDAQRPVLLAVSGASEKGRATACGAIAAVLREGAAVADVAGTLALRRSHLDRRCVVSVRSRDQAIAALEGIARGEEVAGATCGRRSGPHRLAFVFTGQGAQWAGMGRGLLSHDPIFRRSIQQCDDLFRPLAGWSIVDTLLDQDPHVFDRTSIAQPATFAVQVGLAASLAALGVKPECVIGHSIGEIAAAYVCGALSIADAVQVVFHRSRLQERTRFMGSMAAVGLSADAARARLAGFVGKVEVAAINGPELITVAGEKAALTHFVDQLREDSDDIFCQFLRVDYAFHTVQMDPFKDELRANLQTLRPGLLRIPMISTVTGSPIEDVELDADYWCDNMREPVLFETAVHRAIDYGFTTFVELGPHHALLSSVKACTVERGTAGLVVPTLRRDAPDQDSLEHVFSTLHANGVSVDWRAVTPSGWRFVDLPGASFERISCWAESEESRHARCDGPAHPLLGMRLTSAKAAWQSEVDAHTPRYLADHRVEGSVLFPASAYVELMLAAASETFGEAPWEIERLVFHEALSLGEDGIFIETAVNSATGSVEVRSRMRGGTEWTLRASGVIRSWQIPIPVLDAWRPDPQPPLYAGRTRFYRELAREGHDFGPAFQGVDTVWGERDAALGRITVPESAGELSNYILHPALLDACFQTIRALQGFEQPSDGISVAIPSGIDAVRLFRRPGRTVFSRVTKTHSTNEEIVADLQVLDESGAMVATIDGFRCRRIRRPRQANVSAQTLLLEETWTALAPVDPIDRAPAVGTWLLVGDQGDIAKQLGALLEAKGGHCILVQPALTEAETKALGDIVGAAGRIRGIVYLGALGEDATLSASRLERTWNRESAALLALIRAFKDAEKKPRLHVVTAGCVSLGRNDPVGDAALLLAPLTGMLRTLGNETPDFSSILIDLDPKDVSAATLYQEIMARPTETEIALRDGRRFGSRLKQVSLDGLPKRRAVHDGRSHSRPFRLSMAAPGIIDNLQLVEAENPKVGAGEVLIEIGAVGLNFRDVMAATGLLPAQAEHGPAWQQLGIECAGIVTAVGEGVDPNLMGKRVAAFAPGCFASHVCVSRDMVFVIPQTMSLVDAAAIPVAFATAHYALTTLGRLSPGERVLIHGAAGGVGLAAVAIAQACGAEVHATAGTSEKRALLHGLGVKHVFDSRTLAFFDDVMAATGGKGVDVILNSLSGPFLERSMKALSAGGRFLEIGKRDVYANTAVGLHALRQNASLFVIDLARLAAERPQVLRSEIETVIAALQGGEFRSLPVQCFPIGAVADAFHHMASAKHVGKVVVTLDGPAEIVCATKQTFQAASDGAYLITGGTSGLGLATAQWLAQRGARNLVVLGRKSPRPEALEALAALQNHGVRVDTFAADVSNRHDLAQVLAEIERTRGPLRGVIHAAGVIDDALVDDLAQDKVMRVFKGKVAGAWNLHALTKEVPLDFFVMLSSIAESIGSIGQAHYAAANRSLHALAALRHRESRPALAISLGPISDCGHLTQRPELASYMSGSGVRPMPMARMLEALDGLLQTDAYSVGCADIDWSALARSHQAVGQSPRTIELLSVGERLRTGAGGTLSMTIHAAPPQQRAEIVTSYLRRQVAGILKTNEEAVDPHRPLNELGLDSLTSFELKNRVEADFGFALPIGKFVQRPTIATVTAAILEKFDLTSTTSAIAAGYLESAELAMAPGQKALWFIDQVDSSGTAYCLTMAVAVQPKLDRAFADQAFSNVVARHDALRMAFSADSYGPVPFLLDANDIQIKWHDATNFELAALQRALDNIANTPFVLSSGPLVQVHVFERVDSDIMLLHLHHIIADAASISIVVEELFETYVRLRSGRAAPAQRPPARYGAFAEWQAALVRGPEGEAHRAYWQAQLAGCPAHLSLNPDRPRLSRHGSGAAFRFKLARDLVGPLKELAQSEGTTLFCVLLAAFNVLLHREAGDADIIVGTPTTGRTRPEFERMVGYLVNAVPIRTRLSATDSYRSILTQTSSTVRRALEHQDYPFTAIVHDAGVTRDAEHAPLFQVMFNMERAAAIDASGFSVTLLNTKGPRLQVHDMTMSALELRRQRTQFDLAFAVEEFDGQVLGVVDYRSDRWDEGSIGRMADHYQNILQAFARTPDRLLAPERSGPSRERTLTGPVTRDSPDVVDAIHAAAAAHARRCAIVAADGEYTYAELIGRAQAIASALIVNGVVPGAIVALYLERGRDLPAAMLGALMARATYVPLDPSYPHPRILQILTDTVPALVLINSASASHPPANLRSLNLDTIAPCSRTLSSPPRSDDIAYVIHTSGSTGVPAGVEITRGALCNFLAGMTQVIPLSSDDRLLAITTLAFDIAVLELLLPLTLGATVAIDDGSARDGRRLAARIAKGDITAMQATPATWQMLLDAGWNGDPRMKAFCGGEALPRDLARKLRARTGRLWNLYGPTETTIWSIAAEIDDAEAVSIGWPIANTECRIVNERLERVAPGAAGELLIGGMGLARGYRNDPRRTAERFIPDPDAPSGGKHMFRTGDLVRQREDGALIHLGRNDRQIKLRGVRIEPEEIEVALRALRPIRDAAVVVVGETLADRRLVAFVTCDPAESFSARSALQSLRDRLPAAMVPSALYALASLPRLPNGKLDYKQLIAQAEQSERSEIGDRAADDIEACLISVLADTLGRKDIGVNDDFFFAGGTSLLAMRYLARASEAFGVDIEVSDLLRAPTVALMAVRVRNLMRTAGSRSKLEQNTYRPPWKPLALARAEAAFLPCTASAITYLPDDLAKVLGFSRVTSMMANIGRRNDSSHWTGVCQTALGSVALITIPRFGRDLLSSSEPIVPVVKEAILHARRIGGHTISMTGILPAITGLCSDLAPHEESITTGHATTACAIVLSIREAIRAARRNLRNEVVAFVGLGAIGTATLRLLLDKLQPPQRIILCDVPGKRAEVEALAREVEDTHRCRTQCITSPGGRVPSEIYQATVIVGATNVTDLIEVGRLRPGTILVDDSFPHCFDLADAIDRAERKGDVLIAAGGRLAVPGSMEWHVAAPPGIAGFVSSAIARELSLAHGTITGCILSSLLTATHGAPATVGPTTLASSRTHWDILDRLKARAAPLHCGSLVYSGGWLKEFSAQFEMQNHVL